MKKNHEILTTLRYKTLYIINRSEKWGKKDTSRAYGTYFLTIPSS
jgi:hypothetical protein